MTWRFHIFMSSFSPSLTSENSSIIICVFCRTHSESCSPSLSSSSSCGWMGRHVMVWWYNLTKKQQLCDKTKMRHRMWAFSTVKYWKALNQLWDLRWISTIKYSILTQDLADCKENLQQKIIGRIHTSSLNCFLRNMWISGDKYTWCILYRDQTYLLWPNIYDRGKSKSLSSCSKNSESEGFGRLGLHTSTVVLGVLRVGPLREKAKPAGIVTRSCGLPA